MGGKLSKDQKSIVTQSNLSDREVKSIKKCFREVKGKKNSNQDLNLDEFKKVFSIWAHSNSSVDLDSIFASIDVNKSGSVSFTELILWLSIYARGSEEEKLQHLFTIVDEDGNGVVEGSEIETVLNVLATSATEQNLSQDSALNKALAIIHQLDKDKDGKITLEEWLRIGKELGLVDDLLGPTFINVMSSLKIRG
eukprot:TRINITY_DN3384_c0_g1_i1.p1 TRINITY_DN3384_c0_g1~~TRINITY_DN3384_c0_g1_i1.p1  ORF type:complete len:195 (+),score=37.74 TRINITY_DN3384_c0_g1_i1:68-652(+)